MLMVVIGAGASYDSVNTGLVQMNYGWQPPLADQLFDPKFSEALSRYQRCVPIVDRLRGLPDGTTLEQVLEELTAEAASYPARRSHLTAVQFYLREILWNCGETWWQQSHRATNYVALLDRIEVWRQASGDQVLIVTFNYDRLIEHAFTLVPRFEIQAMADYVSREDYRLIKAHRTGTQKSSTRRSTDSISTGRSSESPDRRSLFCLPWQYRSSGRKDLSVHRRMSRRSTSGYRKSTGY